MSEVNALKTLRKTTLAYLAQSDYEKILKAVEVGGIDSLTGTAAMVVKDAVRKHRYTMNKAAGNSQPLADALKILLADNVSVYSRAHGYHWNVEGQDFTEYHILFGEIYNDLQDSIDPLGESIRKLGDYSPYRLQDFVTMRTIQDLPVPPNDPISMARDLLVGIDALLAGFNKTAAVATQLNEQGVLNFLVGRVEMLQKWKWQLTSSLQANKLETNL